MSLRALWRRWAIVVGPLAVFAATCAMFTALNPRFATTANVKIVLAQVAVLTIVTMAMTMIVRTGGVDLSLAIGLDLGALVAIALMREGYIFPIGLAGGVLAGALVGSANALMIVAGRMDPILTTLGVFFVGQGIQQAYTKGGAPQYLPADVAPDAFKSLGHGELLGLPVPVFVALAVIVGFYVLLERTRYGRSLAAIGAQPRAAVIAGLRVRRDVAAAYVLSGIVGALAGIVFSAVISSYVPQSGFGYLLDSVGAVFIGMSLHPANRPNVAGSVLGVLFFGVLANGMNLAGIPFQWQSIAKGGLLLLVLSGNAMLRRSQPSLLSRVRRALVPVTTSEAQRS
jgi:ribose transport system permease protein